MVLSCWVNPHSNPRVKMLLYGEIIPVLFIGWLWPLFNLQLLGDDKACGCYSSTDASRFE